MKQYEHIELGKGSDASVERVPYQGRDILVLQRGYESFCGWERLGRFIIVPGFVHGDYMKQRGTLPPVTDVEPITDETQRRELTDLLRQRRKEEIFNLLTSKGAQLPESVEKEIKEKLIYFW